MDVADLGLQADEEILVRALAADPRSDWLHAYSSGDLVLTDRRLILRPWALATGPGFPSWEVPIDSLERVSSVPVPVWLFGLVRIWLHGVRLVTSDGGRRTVIVGRRRAAECVAVLDAMLAARRRSSGRVGAVPFS